MTPKQEAAMRQALEALEVATTPLAKDRQEVLRARAAIREALAEQPAQPCGYPYCGCNSKAWCKLERMAENARELGLDYEPPCKTGSQCTSKCQQCEQPAKEQKLEFVSPGGGYVPAIPRPIPLDWKLVPRKATPEMLRAMDECAQEGYDERLYEGMASSVYMAAWDASPVMGTLPEQPAQQQEPVATLDDIQQEIYENTREFVSLNVMEWMLKRYYTPPASKPWVGLTQQDINIAFDDTQEGGGFDDFARAIETKLREKNAPQQSKEDA